MCNAVVATLRELTKYTDDLLRGAGRINIRQSVAMNYRSYDDKIINTHRVKLSGWPDDVAFDNPGDLDRAGLTQLVKALDDGTCRWVSLTSAEITERLQAPLPVPDASKKGSKRKAVSGKEPAKKKTRKSKKNAQVTEEHVGTSSGAAAASTMNGVAA